MKSNKARKIIADNLEYSDCSQEYVIAPKKAVEAVNEAEIELIQKAIETFCWVRCYKDRDKCEACIAKSVFVAKIQNYG